MGIQRDFEETYVRAEPAVRAFVMRRSAPSDVDDVVSEVFVSAWRRSAEIPDEPLPWLFNIARGLMSNHRRSDGRGVALLERLRQEAIVSAAARAVAVDLGVFEALGLLREPDREVLLLAAWEGLTPVQLAVVLGVSRSTAAVRLHRARRRFAQALERIGGTSSLTLETNVEATR